MMLRKLGFTMIELLIVIAVLGILAVAVLAAINPIEQINRGRDTGSRSDSEQLISAIDRYYASKGYYPWLSSATTTNEAQAWTPIDTAWVDNAGTPEPVLDKLSGSATSANGTGELKASFVDRIAASDYNRLYVYNPGTAGSSTYVCFTSKSQAFQTEAKQRCEGTQGAMPSDIAAAALTEICGTCSGGTCSGDDQGKYMTCLP